MTELAQDVLSAGYKAAVSAREWMRRRGLGAAERRLPHPVMSIGNLAMGGTGKTPFTETLARLLSAEGFLVCILSRGHGGLRDRDPLLVSDGLRLLVGPTEAGDEAFLLARRLPGVLVSVGRDRHEAGLLALDGVKVRPPRDSPALIFLLDDGFQHRRLFRDVDWVLLDAQSPWSGLQREGRSSLSRADAVVLTRAQHASEADLGRARREIAAVAEHVPIVTTRTVPCELRRLPSGERRPLGDLRGKRVLAACGIGRPESFLADVAGLGATIVRTRVFEDHHPFTPRGARSLLREADEVGAAAIVTTEKDAVRLPLPPAPHVPVVALAQRLLFDDQSAFLRVLADLLPTNG